ncbi:MAG: cobalamin B12-binding domain-containing protein [Candidatus Hydrogenedentes bacterium]|nr:cobalamin B12-binding domain-containing protein [Candidatus Hydrogenedentota bacterium]
MKILFSVSVSKERFNCIPDLGQGYLMSIARNAGHEVKFVDCLLEHYTYDDFERAVREYAPDMVGLKAYSADLEPIAEMLRRIKAVSPSIATVLGGPHPSTEIPDQLFRQFPEMDYAIAGEAEPGFARFLERIAAGRTDLEDIQGLVWKDTGGAVRANPKTLVEDLSTLPMPAWDLMDPRRYRWGYSFLTARYPAAPMAMTRGCPYLCTFCGSYLVTGRKIRKRSVDGIIEEIRYLQKDYGVQTVDLVDENFSFDRNFVVEVCTKFLSENVKIAWNCPYGVRLDRLDEETVKLMRRAGCFAFAVGIESGSNRILKQIKKALTVETVREKVHMIKRVSDMAIMGYFIIGFPSETREEIESTIQLACSLPLDIATFHPLRVTPGTEIYEDLVAAGAIFPHVEYTGLGHHYFVRSYCPVPDEEMRRLYKKAYASFYFRPKVALNLIRRVRSPAQVHTIVNGLTRMLKRPIGKFDPRKKKSLETAPTA